MTPGEFASALMAYCQATSGSVTSWGRSTQHNQEVGGVVNSSHRLWVAADVVYDTPVAEDQAVFLAKRLGLRLIRESDHDHLQAV